MRAAFTNWIIATVDAAAMQQRTLSKPRWAIKRNERIGLLWYRFIYYILKQYHGECRNKFGPTRYKFCPCIFKSDIVCIRKRFFSTLLPFLNWSICHMYMMYTYFKCCHLMYLFQICKVLYCGYKEILTTT